MNNDQVNTNYSASAQYKREHYSSYISSMLVINEKRGQNTVSFRFIIIFNFSYSYNEHRYKEIKQNLQFQICCLNSRSFCIRLN